MLARLALLVNALVLAAIAGYFFLAPFAMLVQEVRDPSLFNGSIPKVAYRWHRQMSDDFADWANERTAAGTAVSVDVLDISGTEWPMFSAVFYLWSSETLQRQFDSEGLTGTAPKQYSQRALDAAADLIADPNNANWVKQHWGENYLHRENIFYRMLMISGLTSYQNLTGNDRYQSMLEDQVQSLRGELQRSPHGLLDDYPHQCYPVDVLPAIAAIKRADGILGTDSSAFVENAVRGFEDERIDAHTQLPAYIANSKTGVGHGPARGVGIAYMLIWAPELWPQTATLWYSRYDDHFWQQSAFIASVREFSKHSRHSDWQMDVDAGPVFAGIGTAASAFGIGAARANGRMDQAYALNVEALVAAWPLPNGTLLIPRLLSNLSDAPYVGEAALLFSMTRMPVGQAETEKSASVPLVVYATLLLYGAIGALLLLKAFRNIVQLRRSKTSDFANSTNTQGVLWLVLVSAGIFAFSLSSVTAILILLVAMLFPRLPAR